MAESKQALKCAILGVCVFFAACAGTSLDIGATDAGSGGSGGSDGAGIDECARELPDEATVGCNWRAALGAPGQIGYCFKGGCHNANTYAGNLDLTPNDYLAARLLNVPAAHDIECGGAIACQPEEPACQGCADCPSAARLIDTRDPASSWMLRKLEPFVPGVTTDTTTMSCGDVMPTFNTTGTATYTQAHKDCLIAFFTTLAATPGNWPCFGP